MGQLLPKQNNQQMYFSNRISKIFYVYWIITVCNNGLQWGFSQQATATTQIAWPITYIFTPYTANAIGVMPETEITVHVLIQNLTNQNGVFVSGNTESNDFKSLNFYWLTIGK